MPSLKRYFPCSRDIATDPEVLEMLDLFGYKTILLWLHILSTLDKENNHWKLSGRWKNNLARIAHMSEKTVETVMQWMIEKGWIATETIREENSKIMTELSQNYNGIVMELSQNCDGVITKLSQKCTEIVIVSAPNYMKYHRTREPQNQGPASLLTYPNLSEPIRGREGPSVPAEEGSQKPSAFDRPDENFRAPISEPEIRSSRSGPREIFETPISEVKKEATPPSPPSPRRSGKAKGYQRDQRFEKFWLAYPNKRNKGTAEKAWHEDIAPDDLLAERITRKVEQAKQCIDWQRDGGRYIPHPATWLRAKGWEDEYAPQKKYGEELSL